VRRGSLTKAIEVRRRTKHWKERKKRNYRLTNNNIITQLINARSPYVEHREGRRRKRKHKKEKRGLA
jgi:ribosomal protein S30